MDQEKIIESAIKFVKDSTKDASPTHDWWHTKRVYSPRETVYVKAGGFLADKTVDIYVIKHNASIADGDSLTDVSTDGKNTVKLDSKGSLYNFKIASAIACEFSGSTKSPCFSC